MITPRHQMSSVSCSIKLSVSIQSAVVATCNELTKQTNYTHLLLGLSSLTTVVVFSFQSSMTSTDKQQWIQNARINHNLLYISTQCTLTHCWDWLISAAETVNTEWKRESVRWTSNVWDFIGLHYTDSVIHIAACIRMMLYRQLAVCTDASFPYSTQLASRAHC